jgi:hypothetical protein
MKPCSARPNWIQGIHVRDQYSIIMRTPYHITPYKPSSSVQFGTSVPADQLHNLESKKASEKK